MRNRTRYNKVPTNERKYRRRTSNIARRTLNEEIEYQEDNDDDDEEEEEEDDDNVPNEEQQFLQQNTTGLSSKHRTVPITHIELNRIYKHHEQELEVERERQQDEDEEEMEEQQQQQHEYQRRRRRSPAVIQHQQQQQHIRPHLPSTSGGEGHQQSQSRGVESMGQLATLVHIQQDPTSNHRTSRIA